MVCIPFNDGIHDEDTDDDDDGEDDDVENDGDDDGDNDDDDDETGWQPLDPLTDCLQEISCQQNPRSLPKYSNFFKISLKTNNLKS